ncbi:MAG: hypothetical protein ACK45B_12570 [Limisphaerales bacterium]
MRPPVECRVSRLSLASIQPARFVGILIGMAVMLYGEALPAAPREVLPPWPEPTLGIWGFNHWHTPMLPGRTVVGIEAAQVAESWSGYALVRDALSVSPVAIPVLEPANGSRNFATDQGTIRFRFRPDWSSATHGGQGPGDYVRLLELVALGGREPQVMWSLYLNPEGTAVYLSGQGVGGPMDFLKAEVNWTAGQWRMLALAYDGGGTTLTVDRAAVAVGPALPPVATWQRDALALVVGSALSGAGMAQGEFEELCTFDHVVALKDLAFYWRGQRRWVALGPVGTEAEEAAKLATLDERMQMMTLASGTLASAAEEAEPAEGPLPEMSYTSREYLPGELWLEMLGVTNGVAWVKLHGTEAGEWYELQSREDLVAGPGWQVAGPLWPGSEAQDWTLATVTTGGRTNLFLRARSWVDADGNGLPDWWEQEVFGQAGVDPYGDPDGGRLGELAGVSKRDEPQCLQPAAGTDALHRRAEFGRHIGEFALAAFAWTSHSLYCGTFGSNSRRVGLAG